MARVFRRPARRPGAPKPGTMPACTTHEPHRNADHALGAAGEAAAARWLIRRGWRILATGWRGGGGEIDIVAERRGIVAACEVKTRTTHDPHRPPLRPAQQERLARAALAWSTRHPAFARHAIRPDLIVVQPDGPRWRITRIEDITPERYSNSVRWPP
jgi:putative endonuclease